jgi:hypothetical protein
MLKWLGSFILNIGVEKVIDLLIDLLERLKAFQKIKEETAKSLEPLRKAETNEDIDKAADDTLDKF